MNLKKILLKAKRQVFSELVGNNPSKFKGEGYDFLELREYNAGDDIRHIDWNITAKMQKPFIKVFREERELNVVLASMLNGSVYFGSKKFKQELIVEINALLAYSALKNSDLLTSYIFADKHYITHKPTKRLFAVEALVKDLSEFDPLHKKANYDILAKSLYKSVKRKSLMIIIGDFFEIPDFTLLSKKHELIVIIVRDKLEESPPLMGFSSLSDPESGAILEGDFNSSSIKAYEQKVKEHDHKLYESFRKAGVKFTKIYTDSIVSVELRRLFGGR